MNKTGVIYRLGELGRGENRKVCSCGWEPCATVGVKRNKMSMHVRGGNKHWGEQREPRIRQDNENNDGVKSMKQEYGR